MFVGILPCELAAVTDGEPFFGSLLVQWQEVNLIDAVVLSWRPFVMFIDVICPVLLPLAQCQLIRALQIYCELTCSILVEELKKMLLNCNSFEKLVKEISHGDQSHKRTKA